MNDIFAKERGRSRKENMFIYSCPIHIEDLWEATEETDSKLSGLGQGWRESFHYTYTPL